MKLPVYICLLLLFIAVPPNVSADERADVLQAISTLFGAMELRDVELSKSVMMPAGEYMNGDNLSGVQTRGTEFADYLKGLSEGDELLQERLIKPSVMVSGNIASIWSDYQFYIDGKLSHCGVDNFSLVKVKGSWRVVYSTFTVERSARCETLSDKNEWINGLYILN